MHILTISKNLNPLFLFLLDNLESDHKTKSHDHHKNKSHDQLLLQCGPLVPPNGSIARGGSQERVNSDQERPHSVLGNMGTYNYVPYKKGTEVKPNEEATAIYQKFSHSRQPSTASNYSQSGLVQSTTQSSSNSSLPTTNPHRNSWSVTMEEVWRSTLGETGSVSGLRNSVHSSNSDWKKCNGDHPGDGHRTQLLPGKSETMLAVNQNSQFPVHDTPSLHVNGEDKLTSLDNMIGLNQQGTFTSFQVPSTFSRTSTAPVSIQNQNPQSGSYNSIPHATVGVVPVPNVQPDLVANPRTLDMLKDPDRRYSVPVKNVSVDPKFSVINPPVRNAFNLSNHSPVHVSSTFRPHSNPSLDQYPMEGPLGSHHQELQHHGTNLVRMEKNGYARVQKHLHPSTLARVNTDPSAITDRHSLAIARPTPLKVVPTQYGMKTECNIDSIPAHVQNSVQPMPGMMARRMTTPTLNGGVVLPPTHNAVPSSGPITHHTDSCPPHQGLGVRPQSFLSQSTEEHSSRRLATNGTLGMSTSPELVDQMSRALEQFSLLT